ncbi:hypothetical protein NBRGN_029_00280 [Nocardia brasiliensis NBRC 14402]|nr:hypothetical protein CEQ30_19570 [Nocardia brasiliensis]GAJ80700.1 hypothetical protein NBRGN_029_00280 [Nocardia brasiliensis NBRC 14402]
MNEWGEVTQSCAVQGITEVSSESIEVLCAFEPERVSTLGNNIRPVFHLACESLCGERLCDSRSSLYQIGDAPIAKAELTSLLNQFLQFTVAVID